MVALAASEDCSAVSQATPPEMKMALHCVSSPHHPAQLMWYQGKKLNPTLHSAEVWLALQWKYGCHVGPVDKHDNYSNSSEQLNQIRNECKLSVLM